MSGPTNSPARGDAIPRQVRPLPSAPSLEHERKQAKTLLKAIRTSNADALHRVQAAHPISLRDRQHSALQLADAQHVIAREYGFTSWPRLVGYFGELERHRNAPRHNSSDGSLETFTARARSIVRRHTEGDVIVARELAHFVPRFYSRTRAEVLASPITDDDARLVVARQNRRVSWQELIERADASRSARAQRTWDGEDTAADRARVAIRNHAVDALRALLDEHPELLTPSVVDREWRSTLGSMALSVERTSQSAEARRITDLLASRGVDVQRELDERLLGWPQDGNKQGIVQWYLDRGANPNWMPPNGITVLEHAIIRYKWTNGASVDPVAARVTPRRALWIAAGLGDVAGVRSFIAGRGRLVTEARLNRPDLVAMGSIIALPPNPEADDLEIMWEAFMIAGWNERWTAMDALLDAGLPVDHAPLGLPLLFVAVGNLFLLPLAEYLVSRGADLDREWRSPANGSARELAREHVRNNPQNEDARRLLSICGAGTPGRVLAEMDAKRQSPPPLDERTMRAMQLAADDAARQGQSAVTTENMLVGFLRVADGVYAEFFTSTGTDMPKLRAMIGARLLPDGDPLVGQELPADAVTERALRAAADEAFAQRRESASPLHLLWGILRQQHGPGARLLADVGFAEARLAERLRGFYAR